MMKTTMPFMDAPGFKEGIESGLPGVWTVAKEYGVVNGRIVGFGLLTDAKKHYRPMLQPELLSELLKVDPADEQQILEFVRNYGVLGGQTYYVWPQEESLEWFQQAVRVLNAASSLWRCISERDEQDAARYHEEVENNKTIAGVPVPVLVDRHQHGFDSGYFGVDLADPLTWARHMFSGIIYDNIRGVTRHPVLTPEGIQSYFRFNSLLDVIYWMMLDAAEGGNLKLCKMCHKPFISTDGRQRFCHKRPWQKETSESHCSILYRQRKRRGTSE